MGIPWRSAESMHWQLGEQEMSARANAPVFQLHPSAHSSTVALSSPQAAPTQPATHGFTPTNASQLIPNAPPPLPPQAHQPAMAPQPSPLQPTYHQRTDSGSSQGRRRNSSFSRRRADARSRSSVPPQLGPPLPQLHPASKADLISGAKTAPVPDAHPGVKREAESVGFVEPYLKRRREEDAVAVASPYRPDPDVRSQEGRSPDRSSQRSGTGSVKSARSGNRPPETPEKASMEPPPVTS
jgi:hypothetical protein